MGCIFRSRIINEIKNKITAAPYEKSRLVIQGYADDGKETILTQAPMIQCASQCLTLALMPSLLKKGMIAWIRDITQAYVQSETGLNREILAHLPVQIRDKYPKGTVMQVVKPLYEVAEAGTHWWVTYHNHHLKKLQMITSTYDPCLLQTNKPFSIVGLQTNDTLFLADKEFADTEQNKLHKAKFMAKECEQLTADTPLKFNGSLI